MQVAREPVAVIVNGEAGVIPLTLRHARLEAVDLVRDRVPARLQVPVEGQEFDAAAS